MLESTNLVGFGAGSGTSIKVFELDAGKSASWPNTGNTWKNIAEPADGQARSYYDFEVGAAGGSSAYYPTFTGTPNGQSANEYFSSDGDDWFGIDNIPHGAYFDSLHQDNAAWWAAFAVYFTSSSGGELFTTTGGGEQGTQIGLTSMKPSIIIRRTGGSSALSATADIALSNNAWHVVGFSINEASALGFLYVDGVYAQVSSADTFNATYSSPSGGTIQFWPRIPNTPPSGTRIAWAAFGKGYITKAQMDVETVSIRARLGL